MKHGFDIGAWALALESYGAVAQLTMALYDGEDRIVCGPVSMTPIFAIFQEHSYDPGLFADCARVCLAQQSDDRPPVILTQSSGLAVVGVSLVLDGQIVGAVVAGYALIGFNQSVTVGRLARAGGVPFQDLWAVMRRQRPVSRTRLLQHGALLQVLGDTLLREHALRQQSETAAEQLTHLASHDPLTNLPNRRLTTDRLMHALAVARRNQHKLAVLFIDIDHFKGLNDTLGHLAGDHLLQTVARDIANSLRASDTVGRYGGDEFVVVLSEVAHAEDAGKAADKVIAALARPHDVAGQTLYITVSVGISVFPDDGADETTLLMCADMALYHAKDQGRDGYRFFKVELNQRAVTRRSVEAALHRALQNNEFELHYQPKVNLTSRRVIGAEALVRWRHPDRGLVAPADFIPIAEDCGLIRPIGRWVLLEACRQAYAWQQAGLRPIPIAVNISAVEFSAKGFLTNVVDVLTQTKLQPHNLELELTERVLLRNVSAATATLRALKGVGVQLAMDDFGSGCSGLGYLRDFAFDAVKIDKSFVAEITADSHAAPIVSAVISLAKGFNLRAIAEGVETRHQLAFLEAHDCSEGQGYYFCRPLVAPEFARVLQAPV